MDPANGGCLGGDGAPFLIDDGERPPEARRPQGQGPNGSMGALDAPVRTNELETSFM
jgi:hypothetical protein